MDAATINQRIYAGRAKAAARIGYLYNVYRPVSAEVPIGLPIATINAAFNAADNKYRIPNLYGKPIWFADLDGRVVQPGDYLIRTTLSSDVYFIAGMQPLLPIIAIDCPRTVRITAPNATASVGAVGYSGLCDSDTSSTDVLGSGGSSNASPWPCSIVFGKGTQGTKTQIPSGAPKDYGWQILLPPSVPIQINPGMRLIDDLGRKYSVGAAELSDLGWRIIATEEHA